MSDIKKIRTALISAYSKKGLNLILHRINELGIKIYSTGGTADYIEGLGIAVNRVEELTSYPSILGGRVKTLHPKVFGGILGRRDTPDDLLHLEKYHIPQFDLVVVDLYPFEQKVAEKATHAEIIENIDIGGISLIRAAAKNYNDVVIVPSENEYTLLEKILSNGAETTLDERMALAKRAFEISSSYDNAIHRYFGMTPGSADSQPTDGQHQFSKSALGHGFNDNGISKITQLSSPLRYGENPHQKGVFRGNLNDVFVKLHGKELSYNNLLDIDSSIEMMRDVQERNSSSVGFQPDETTFAIFKHNNPCGVAVSDKPIDSWEKALAGDPVSAYGGIIITNTKIDIPVAAELDKLFFEILLAPDFEDGALEILKKKKNRIILKTKQFKKSGTLVRSALGGILEQERDNAKEIDSDLNCVTERRPDNREVADLLFANMIVKFSKSNAIVLVKDRQLTGSGAGQTSRVDALKQAIAKAGEFRFDLHGAVLASDAFLPFADCVEIAHHAGITAVIQPGGSVRDKESINFCNKNNMAMVFTGIRHFRH